MIANVRFENGVVFRATHEQLGAEPWLIGMYHAKSIGAAAEALLDQQILRMAQRLLLKPMEGRA